MQSQLKKFGEQTGEHTQSGGRCGQGIFQNVYLVGDGLAASHSVIGGKADIARTLPHVAE